MVFWLGLEWASDQAGKLPQDYGGTPMSA